MTALQRFRIFAQIYVLHSVHYLKELSLLFYMSFFVKSYNLVFLYYLVIYIFPNLVPNEYCVHLSLLHKDLTKSQWSSLTINFVCTVEKFIHKYFRFFEKICPIKYQKNLVLLHFILHKIKVKDL